MSRSAARRARPARSAGRSSHGQRCHPLGGAHQASRAPPPPPRRHDEPPAARRVPEPESHLRPGHRRHQRPHRGRRLVARGRPARLPTGRRPTTRSASASSSPSAPRPPASSRWCSTGRASSTTGGFARSPRRPARPASTSRGHACGPHRPEQARARGARRPDQPRRQGPQGRPPLLVLGGHRRGRRQRPRRRGPGQGRRRPGVHPEGRRGREEEHRPDPDGRDDDPARGPRGVLRRAGDAQAGLAGHRRHRRRRRACRRRGGRHPRHPGQGPRLHQPGERDPGDAQRPEQPPLGRGAVAPPRHQAAPGRPRPAGRVPVAAGG